MPHDLLIKNGTVIDGSGAPAFRADVAVRAGKVAAVGRIRGAADETIDAEGLVKLDVEPVVADRVGEHAAGRSRAGGDTEAEVPIAIVEIERKAYEALVTGERFFIPSPTPSRAGVDPVLIEVVV